MTHNDQPTAADISGRDTFLKPASVFARYGWGRSKGYQMLHSPGFPNPIGGVYRLDTLRAWETAVLETAPAAVPDSTLAAPDTSPVDVADLPEGLPAKRKPGRKRAA